MTPGSRMRYMVDIGHPAHVHYFRNVMSELESGGHAVRVVARRRDPVQPLLRAYDIPFVDRGRGAVGLGRKLLAMLRIERKLLAVAREFRPDLLFGFANPYVAHVAAALRRPCLVFDDTESARLSRILYRPFASHVVTPESYGLDLGTRHVRFPGYMELAYLHPERFRPDPEIVRGYGIDPAAPYVVARFVGRTAHHDLGRPGLDTDHKLRLVEQLRGRARVLISSEADPPQEMADLAVGIEPEDMHHLLAFATLLYGESATMASEAAVLGTPAIFLDNSGRGYTQEQGCRYGLVANFGLSSDDREEALRLASWIVSTQPEVSWDDRRQELLRDAIDVTAFFKALLLDPDGTVHRVRSQPDYFDVCRHPRRSQQQDD